MAGPLPPVSVSKGSSMRTLLISLLLATPLWAIAPEDDLSHLARPAAASVQAVVPETVKEHELVIVKLSKGERVNVFAQNLMPVNAVQCYGGIVFTGPPGLYAVSVFNMEDPEEVLPTNHYVTITPRSGPTPVPPGPGPVPPSPVPLPEGFARDVYAQAVAVNDKANTARLAANYQMVLSMIAAGGLRDVGAVSQEITRLNKALSLPQTWRPFGIWIGQEATKRSQTMVTTRTFFEHTVAGLEAAAK